MLIRFRIRTILRLTPTSLPPLSKVRCCRPKKFGRLPEGLPHQPFQNRTIPSHFAMLTSVCADTLSHPHYPLPLTKLASLVKGRWIDGKAQALILLLSVCDTPAFFYLSNFSAVKTEGLLYTHQPHHPHNPHKILANPLPLATTLTF